jgi:hypothetical protein
LYSQDSNLKAILACSVNLKHVRTANVKHMIHGQMADNADKKARKDAPNKRAENVDTS